MVLVGDPNQSINLFRGAVTGAMDFVANCLCELGGKVRNMDLPMSFRLPVSHSKLARRVNPKIISRPDAVAGRITTTDWKTMIEILKPGDRVICRVNGNIKYIYILI